ncbi:hypothetical protein KP626_04180 [Christensenella sp. MSJ-20]|uniref:hypothetical protein n=1 Tax=Christensenella sp. MSJ-20 TaxID=2841518 RepID=UPI001C740278|nr:hypothetical protein KP626_04180 [Christensenella sp. MSJ-20]
MKKKPIFLIILVVLQVLLICACGEQQQPAKQNVVSFFELLTHPSRFDGEEVTVRGVLKKETDGYCLYYTRENAKYYNPLDAIWLGEIDEDVVNAQSLEEWNTWFVEVTGVQSVADKGPEGTYACGIKVTKVKKMEIIREPNSYGSDDLGRDIKFD